jgi:hypothetical protein
MTNSQTTLQANAADAERAAGIFRDHLAGLLIDTSDGAYYNGRRAWQVAGHDGWEARESGTTDDQGEQIPLLRVFAPNGVQYNCGLTRHQVDSAIAEDATRELRPYDQRRVAWPQGDGSAVLSVEYA